MQFCVDDELLCSCSEKVWRGVNRWNDSLVIRYCVEEFSVSCVGGRETQDGGHVAGTVTVIRCRPNCYQLLVEQELDACKIKGNKNQHEKGEYKWAE